jgi:hypothetical protein
VAPMPILIPSPLVGPSTWSLVAEEFRRREVETLVPTLDDDGDGGHGLPFWRQHVDAVVRGVTSIPQHVPVALVGHSVAGPLLPAIGPEIGHPVAA